MPLLRAMTFNMQLLQLMPTSGDEAEVRTGLTQDAIKTLPPGELPDILEGNEVQ